MLFLPLFLLVSMGSALVLYQFVSLSYQEQAERMLTANVVQTARFLNDRMYHVFRQFVGFSNHEYLRRVILRHASGMSNSRSASEYAAVSNTAREILDANRELIEGVFVSINDGSFRLLHSNGVVREVSYEFTRWTESRLTSDSDYHWLPDDRNTLFRVAEGRSQPTVLLRVIGGTDSSVQGIVAFLLRSDAFEEVLRAPPGTESGYLLLVAGEASTYEGAKTPQSLELEANHIQDLWNSQNALEKHSFTGGGGASLTVISRELELNGWRVAAVAPVRDLYAEARNLGVLLALGVISTAFVGAVLYTLVARHVTAPLEQLKTRVDSICAENLSAEFDEAISDEIRALDNGISAMVSRLNALIEETAEKERAKRDAQIEALTSQIRPHFLYNALNSVKHFYAMGEREKASTMLNALSDFFRYTMEDWKQLTTIGKEVAHAESFLLIERGRHRASISYYIDIDLKLVDEPIIRIVLQPLVENAIVHGIRGRKRHGRIGIVGYRENDSIALSIVDNGPGIDTEALKTVQFESTQPGEAGESMGLSNTQQRLDAYYGARAELRVENRPGGGCIATVIVPRMSSVQEKAYVYGTHS